MRTKLHYFTLRIVAISVLMFSIQGCDRHASQLPAFQTEYQAVFLDNGQVFFAKIENPGSSYPLLRDVFYLQTQVDPETKQPKSTLIKRGNEWHKPDHMYINARHLVIIEPVGADSRVAQLIKEAKTQKQ